MERISGQRFGRKRSVAATKPAEQMTVNVTTVVSASSPAGM